jgi:predicted secreted protein
MTFTSGLAIYVLFWVITAFIVLPIGVKTHNEMGIDMVPGQADSAPANFRPLRTILITTGLSAVLFGLFYANYVYGWIGVDDVNIFGEL